MHPAFDHRTEKIAPASRPGRLSHGATGPASGPSVLAFLVFLAILAAPGPAFGAAPAAGGSGASPHPGPGSVASPETREALEGAVQDLGLQTDFPSGRQSQIKPGTCAPGTGTPRSGSGGGYSFKSRSRPRPLNIPAEAAQAVLWAAGLAVAVILILTLRDNWRKSGQPPIAAPAAEEAPGAPAIRLGEAQVEADELARRGEFVQAMHVLLLRSVGEMRRRLATAIAASLTSREILARIGLGPEARGALADIIGRVEVSYFGGYQAGLEEYQACRRSFEAFSASLAGREAAGPTVNAARTEMAAAK